MIILKSNNGLSVSLKGRIGRNPTKRGNNIIETNLGLEKTESTRSVINLQLTIQYITEEEYYKLETMFLTSESVDIEDTNKGVYYSRYYIAGDTMSLEEKEDAEDKAYYYVGGIQLNKR